MNYDDYFNDPGKTKFAVVVYVRDYPADECGPATGVWSITDGKWWMDDGDLYPTSDLEAEYGPCEYLSSEELLARLKP